MQRLIYIFLVVIIAISVIFLFVPKNEEKSSLKIEETVFPAYEAISVYANTDMNNLQKVLGDSYLEIVKQMSKSKLKQAAPVLAFYHKFSYNEIEVEPAIPVNKLPEDKIEGFNYLEIKESKVILAHHYGSYESTEKTHAEIDNWINKNNKKIIGSPWEVYISDPSLEADTAKWYTQIYYPIE
jgi:effector-binding domain-containing protein